jgi:hypothetical protein
MTEPIYEASLQNKTPVIAVAPMMDWTENP